ATAEAIALINAVRTRARGAGTVPADYSTSEADQAKIFAWIAKERLAELGGEEGHRWFDLKRWHAAGKINLGAWDWSSASTSGVQFDITKNLLYPLPANELDLNPNMQQNPGY
ncbi:MAG: RagB/SusD family nutrient uptake outer membrane protein, partial [Saprospiraceae bacterium]|nr:RagB/SusD family nutrient uptake outer membrane protein [Saprospiraceae bacterium]